MTRIQAHRPTLLITFSGIDGAGKSTQIDHLCTQLRETGYSVDLRTFWDDAAALKNLREGTGYRLFGGDQGVGSPESPIHRRDKNVRSPLLTLARLGLYLLDALSLRRVARRALASGADVLIFDRYICDELANLELRNSAVRLYAKSILRLVPRPAISFILDADPEQARSRKPEYPLEFIRDNRAAYLRLAPLLDSAAVIPPLPLDQAKTEITRRVLRAIHSRRLDRNGTAPSFREERPREQTISPLIS